MELATLADVRVLVEKHLPKEYRAKFMWRLQRFRRRLWRRLQDRLRLWRLRRVWMLRMRPGLVGTLRRGVRCRDRVCCRCRLLHNLGRLPLLLGNRGGALLGVTGPVAVPAATDLTRRQCESRSREIGQG